MPARVHYTLMTKLFSKILPFLTAAIWAGSATVLFTRCKAVDPLHYEVFCHPFSWAKTAVGTVLAVLAAWIFRKHLAAVSRYALFPAILAAAGAAALPSFSGLLIALWSLAATLYFFLPMPWQFSLPPKLAAWSVAVLTILCWACGFFMQESALRTMYFLYSDWGIYLDGYIKIATGQASWGEILSVGDHWNPAVNLIMAFLTGFIAEPWAIFAVSSALIVSAGPLLYCLARKMQLPPEAALLCAAAGLFCPSLTHLHLGLFYGYHPIEWLIPAVLTFLIFQTTKNKAGMILCLIFACGIQETVFIWSFGFGLMLFLRKNTRWTAAAVMLLSVAAFIIIAWGILPAASADDGYYQTFQYAHLGNSPRELLLAPFLRPAVFWGALFKPGNLLFVLLLLLPAFPFAAQKPQWLFAALPLALAVMLKISYENKLSIVQWYGTDLTMFLLPAMVFGMSKLFREKRLTVGMAAWSCFAIFGGYLFFGKTLEAGYYSFKPLQERADRTAEITRLQNMIPAGAEVALPPRLNAHFFLTHTVRNFDQMDPVPEWRILDLGDSFVSQKEMTALREKLYFRQQEVPVATFNVNDRQYCVYRKGSEPWKPSFMLPDSIVQKIPHRPFKTDDDRLETRVLPDFSRRNIMLFFRLRDKVADDCKFQFHLRSQGRQFYYFTHWGNGLITPGTTPEKMWFTVTLPFPAGWNVVEDLRIKTTWR